MTSFASSPVSILSIHAANSSPWLSKSMHSRFPETPPATMHTASCGFENHALVSTAVGSLDCHVFQPPIAGRFFCLLAGRHERPAARYASVCHAS